MAADSSSRPERGAIELFLEGLRDLRRAWPQFIAADLATRVAATLLLTPVVGFVAQAALSRSQGGAATDMDILWFVLSPLGIVTLLFVAGGAILAGFIGHTAIMTVAAGFAEDRSVSWLVGIRHALHQLARIFEMAVRATIRLIIDALPWVLVAGGIYLLMLTDHDINYYLAEKPTEFWVAGALIGVALLGLVFFVGRRLLGWSVALPRLLFGGVSPAQALKESAKAVQGRRRRALLLLVLWGGATLAATAVVTGVSGWLGQLFIPEGTDQLAPMAAGIAIAVILGGVGSLVVSVVSSIVLALSLFELDRMWATPWQLPRHITTDPGTLGKRATLAVPGWAWVLVAIAVPAGIAFLGVLMLEKVSVEHHVEILAHRGASGRAPENTLAAFRAAIEDDAEWIELDVQETSDGVVAVHHDADFMRVAKDPRKIWEASWDEVSQIPNGGWFGPEFESERVASLEDALRLADDRIRVNIELKTYGHGQRLEESVIEIVERLDMADRVVLMSLSRPIVAKLKELRPEWTVGLLAAVSIGDLTRLQADFLAVSAGNASSSLVRRTHESGKRLLVWTVNHPAQMSSMMTIGVDGIITDEPALARDVMQQRAEMTPVERLLVSAGARFGIIEGADVTSDEGDA